MRSAPSRRRIFTIGQSAGPIDLEQWQRSRPHRATPLGWHLHRDCADIRLSNPSEYRRRTKWPAFLPSPLFTLRLGETARIDWNGRLRTSLFRSNRSQYYEQHIYWLARRRPRAEAVPRRGAEEAYRSQDGDLLRI